jgi:hypothetical protein
MPAHTREFSFASIAGLVLSVAFQSAAQAGPPPPATNVLYGFITSNRTLTFATPGPIYYLPGDLVVNPGVTLTVEPGVSILFAAERDTLGGGDYPGLAELTLQGTLVAIGTPTSPIQFSATEAGAGKWGQIRVLSGASLQLRDINLSGAATAIVSDGYLDVSRLVATTVQNGTVVNGSTSGRIFDSKFVGVGSGTGLVLRMSGITAAPDSTDARPCDISGFSVGVQILTGGINVSHIVSHDNQYGCRIQNANDATLAYMTIVRNSEYGIDAGTSRYYVYSSIITNNMQCGVCFSFNGGFTNYVDSWSNGTNFSGSRGPLTASFNPLYVDYIGSDLHLSAGSPFKTYGPWGAEIGAYGPGPGSPTPAHSTSWGRLKASYR